MNIKVPDITNLASNTGNQISNSVDIREIIIAMRNELNEIKEVSVNTINKIDNLTNKVGEIVYNFIKNKIAPFVLLIIFIFSLPIIINVLNLISNITCIGSNILKK